mmetsp:Transcript_22799/g.54953  ORF Transcript_22799/g.54953 Transcript_22799/m.54953 type:complete len:200 (-) Transcript_22799:702-1301(-)
MPFRKVCLTLEYFLVIFGGFASSFFSSRSLSSSTTRQPSQTMTLGHSKANSAPPNGNVSKVCCSISVEGWERIGEVVTMTVSRCESGKLCDTHLGMLVFGSLGVVVTSGWHIPRKLTMMHRLFEALSFLVLFHCFFSFFPISILFISLDKSSESQVFKVDLKSSTSFLSRTSDILPRQFHKLSPLFTITPFCSMITFVS